MWLTHGDATFLEGLIGRPAVVESWRQMLQRDERAATPLNFCEAVSTMRNLECDAWRAALFDIGERFLGCSYSDEVDAVNRQVQEVLQETLERLAEEEFALFLASPMCTELVYELQETYGGERSSPDFDELFLRVLSTGTSSAASKFVSSRPSRDLPSIARDPSAEAGPQTPSRSSVSKAVQIPSGTPGVVMQLQESLDAMPVAVVICDRQAPGLPIVAVNMAFTKLTGFEPRAALGYNCREVLQGSETELASIKVRRAYDRACRLPTTVSLPQLLAVPAPRVLSHPRAASPLRIARCPPLTTPRTPPQEIASAMQLGKECRVLLTNYREDSSSFRNQVSLSPPLCFTDDTELVVAVLQAQPAPLEVERAARQADEIIAALVSCSVPRPPADGPAAGFDRALLRVGWQWLSDVETTWRKAMRMQTLRNLFLKFALQENSTQARIRMLALPARLSRASSRARLCACSRASSTRPVCTRAQVAEGVLSGAVAAEEALHNVHLMLHSDNVLSDRGDYVRIACELFSELENLKSFASWEQKASLGSDAGTRNPCRRSRRGFVLRVPRHRSARAQPIALLSSECSRSCVRFPNRGSGHSEEVCDAREGR